MKQIASLLLLLFPFTLLAQVNHEYGSTFTYDLKNEKHAELLLVDNYNTHLFSVTQVDGIMASHKITIRKFDQKNQLVDTYEQAFQSLDASTLFNYLGYKSINNNQAAFFAESYSGKANKKNIYSYLFDKTSGVFSTELVASFPIESAMRSGTTEMKISENGKYIGLLNKKFATKKDIVEDDIIMLDGTSGKQLWKKAIPLNGDSYEKSLTVTNSGKALLQRASRGFKLSNTLTLVSQDTQEEKPLQENVMLQDPVAISIGQADFLLAFNYPAKGLRKGDFEKLMLYDLTNGTILKNNEVKNFNNITDLKAVDTRAVFLQNNEIHLFTEAQVKAGTRAVKVNQFSNMTMDEAYYKYGAANVFVLSFEGELKDSKTIPIDNYSLVDLYHSYAVLNVKGKYVITGGNNIGTYIFPMDNSKVKTYQSSEGKLEDPYRLEGMKYMPQLFAHIPDAKKYILVRMHNDNKMSIVSFTDNNGTL